MIGLELNDAGLMAAGADGALLEIEPGTLASPGVALIEEGRLQVGCAAEKRSRRIPRQINDQFWHRLARDPLRDPVYAGWSHADLVHAHLADVWRRLAPAGEELLVAVPASFSGHQLELLAGIMDALCIPVRGFVPLPMAALPTDPPAEILLHLDIGLQGVLLTALDVRREAGIVGNTVIEGRGLDHLRSAWMQVIADEFVRRTRFDPFHVAETEQTLYDQLPGLVAALESAEDVAVEMATSTAVHRIRLHRAALAEALTPVMDAIHHEIGGWERDVFSRTPLRTILVSHRGAQLPGFGRRLEAATGARALRLEEGAAAKGILAFADALPPREAPAHIPLIRHRSPRGQSQPPSAPATGNAPDPRMPATHLLYRSRGYPLSEGSLVIGRDIPPEVKGIKIRGRTEGVSRRHCTVVHRPAGLVLTDTSTYGTFVDGVKVAGEITLSVGQIIRVGTPGEHVQVIACLEDNDETSAA